MSGPYWSIPDIECPYCHAKDQEAEDLGDHPSFLSGTCFECNKDFSFDTVREEYYDEKGNTINKRGLK